MMKPTTTPLISVLMTTYNRADYIGTAIQSVLDSTYTNFELIIVDDCSTDNTLEVVESYKQKDSRISVYKNDKNLGDYPNRNRAASYAKGDFIKYCDSDEELYPYCLDVMVSCMEKYPESPLGLSHFHDKRRLPYMVTPAEAYRHHYFEGGFFYNAPSSTIIRRKEFEAEGGFGNIRHRGDYDLWLRMGAKYPIVRMPGLLNFDVSHGDQERNKNFLYKKYLNHSLAMKALQDVNCPLSEDERLKAMRIWRNGFIRQNIFSGLMKFKFKDVTYLIKECKVTLPEMVRALKKS